MAKTQQKSIRSLDGIRYDRELVISIREMLHEKHPDAFPEKLRGIFSAFEDFSLEAIETSCESEIEKQLCYALYVAGRMHFDFIEVITPGVFNYLFMRDVEVPVEVPKEFLNYYLDTDMLIIPNLSFKEDGKTVRVDFFLSHKQKGKRKRQFTMIECDSFMYHSSADQLEKEKKRERLLARFPFKLLRFSGREIHRNPTEMAVEILDTCLKNNKYGQK